MSNFKQAVSYLFHGEFEDFVQERFELTDQQLADACSTVNMMREIFHAATDEDFDIHNTIHDWSKRP